ncbi:MAG: hypothetical protein ABI054_05220 [Planctomycetota bacterium]
MFELIAKLCPIFTLEAVIAGPHKLIAHVANAFLERESDRSFHRRQRGIVRNQSGEVTALEGGAEFIRSGPCQRSGTFITRSPAAEGHAESGAKLFFRSATRGVFDLGRWS